MNIQSLSVVVPNKKCINNCKFCVACMETEDYKNQLDHNLPFYDLYVKDYLKRLEFARDNGCNTVMLTGNSEPQQNRAFLKDFGLFMKLMEKPFRNIEMQTTGVLLDEGYLRFLRNHVGVTTISLSLSSFNDEYNAYCNGTKDMLEIQIFDLCKLIKKYDFTLRLSINLTDWFNAKSPRSIFEQAENLGADQIIFRVLYTSNKNTEQDIWISRHSARDDVISNIESYIVQNGRVLNRLQFGALRYSVDGISTVLDNDCMSTEAKESLKYLILREDCKLYSKWDDPASIEF